jgi:hypothetical protein
MADKSAAPAGFTRVPVVDADGNPVLTMESVVLPDGSTCKFTPLPIFFVEFEGLIDFLVKWNSLLLFLKLSQSRTMFHLL